MIKEVKGQAKVSLGLDVIWKSLTKELQFIIPKLMPEQVEEGHVLEGDGGLGTVFLFNFSQGIKTLRYQKEKIVELDETLHLLGLQVVEGGHLDHSFSYYKTTFQLTAAHDAATAETIVDVTVAYEFQAEPVKASHTHMPSITMAHSLKFVKSLESYLLTNLVAAGSLTTG
ncbi:unnamed protein product [Linum tenue]|uniref:Bet v I/Major latex protein domain-containing protein n=1 Tax=Linum tenue TaxID=586396 RepID=A0AAV0GT28_9ROSI|nr:unnamed protein product [Linum tenue]